MTTPNPEALKLPLVARTYNRTRDQFSSGELHNAVFDSAENFIATCDKPETANALPSANREPEYRAALETLAKVGPSALQNALSEDGMIRSIGIDTLGQLFAKAAALLAGGEDK